MNIIFLDCTQNYGFQFSAANTKTELLAKGLTFAGNNCIIHNGLTGCRNLSEREVKEIDNIGTLITYPLHKFSIISFVRNIPTLKRDLKGLSRPGEKNIIVLEAPYLYIYSLYVYYGRKYGYKILTISHEWSPTVKSKYWIKNMLASMYSKVFGWGIHGILPISHYIWEKVLHFRKPMLMTPILAEYPDDIPSSVKEKKFVYCVYAYYDRVITMILDSYKKYHSLSHNPYSLTLVLSGPEKQIDVIRNYIRKLNLDESIMIKTKLPYAELINEYKTASALIIPLDPKSEQDKARFSQKIAEYVSSATAVISCAVGEMPYYFKDRKDIIFADYSKEGFADTMLWVENNKDACVNIGKAGFKVGQDKFNFIKFGKKFDEFLKKEIVTSN